MKHVIKKWGILFHSDNKLDGERLHFVSEVIGPKLFQTRVAARAYRAERFGYIKDRKDLQKEPHGWKWPKVVKLKVSFEEQI